MRSHIISGEGTISAIVDGVTYVLSKESMYYKGALDALKKLDYDLFTTHCDLDKQLKFKSSGKITYDSGVIRYNGSAVDNKLANRIIKMIEDGYDCAPLMKFMELCYQNDNPSVIDRLYDFMESSGIMLDKDGYVVGFKKVRDDGYDYYSRTVLYEVGKTVVISKSACNTDSRNTCSGGLHIGSKNYAENLWYKGRGKVLLLRVNPKNVMCIPEEAGFEKLRACEVEVVAEYNGDKLSSVYDYSSNLADNEADIVDRKDTIDSVVTPKRDSKGRFISSSGPKRDSKGRFC